MEAWAFNMKKKLKRALRWLIIILLILLACFGVGIVGGVPLPYSGNRKQKQEVQIELVDDQNDEEDVLEIKELE